MAIDIKMTSQAAGAIGCVPQDGHIVVRPFEVADAPDLHAYFRGLSDRTRYDRFLGAMSPPSAEQLEKLAQDDGQLHALIAKRDGHAIVGEARYVFDDTDNSVEIALSVADDCRRSGVGSALLAAIERRAEFSGIGKIVGDTLRANDKMLALAKRRGFELTHPPGDWKLVRFQKHVATPAWMLQPQTFQRPYMPTG